MAGGFVFPQAFLFPEFPSLSAGNHLGDALASLAVSCYSILAGKLRTSGNRIVARTGHRQSNLNLADICSAIRFVTLRCTMTFRALPLEILAEYLPKRESIFARPGDSDFVSLGDVEDCDMQDQSETVESAIVHFGQVSDWPDDTGPFVLEVGLRKVLSLVPKVVAAPGWQPLTSQEHERLLAAIYGGLAEAITSMGDRIAIEHLQAGMLAAAAIVDGMRSGAIDNDRHRDAASRVKMLIHYARICQHEDDIKIVAGSASALRSRRCCRRR